MAGGGVDGRRRLLKKMRVNVFFGEKIAPVSKLEPAVNHDNSRKVLVNVVASRPVCFSAFA